MAEQPGYSLRTKRSYADYAKNNRTCLIIPREPYCCPKCVPARRAARHNTGCSGQRRNTAGMHSALETAQFWLLALLRPGDTASAVPPLPRRVMKQNRRSRPRGILKQVSVMYPKMYGCLSGATEYTLADKITDQPNQKLYLESKTGNEKKNPCLLEQRKRQRMGFA